MNQKEYTYEKAVRTMVVHSLPGRVRFFVPGLKDNQLIARNIMQRLSQVTGVNKVKANPLTGRVLVCFNNGQVQHKGLLDVINTGNGLAPVANQRPEESTTLTRKRLIEPEDLPIKKQLFNVLLSSGVLTYLGLKHHFVGRTPLAKHPHLFNLAAATTIVSGYPVLRSGFQGVTKGKINYDLVLSILALGTTLARESIPGLTVMLLANLTALGQSLVLKAYQEALPVLGEGKKSLMLKGEVMETLKWNEAGKVYGHKIVLPALGLASFSGVTGGASGFQRTLAMLLAANPSPVGLAVPTAAMAAMSRAGKKGILYKNARTLEKLSEVDTVIFTGMESFPEVSYRLGDVLPMPGISKAKLFSLAVHGSKNKNAPYSLALRQAKGNWRHGLNVLDINLGKTTHVLVGTEEELTVAGIETKWGTFKARRLQHLAQVPLYVALNGRLAGLIGINQIYAENIREQVNELRALGISNIGVTLEQESSDQRQVVDKLGIRQIWFAKNSEEKLKIVRSLKERGHKVALVLGNINDIQLFQEADVSICTTSVLENTPADVVVYNYKLIPEAFRMALRGEQKVKQNLALVQAANAVGLALGATGRLSPMAAKVYGDLISVAVCLNSFRLLTNKGRKQHVKKA